MIDAKQALKACIKAFTGIGLFSGIINLLMLVVPIYTLQLFDRVLTSQNIDTLILLTLIAIIFLLFLGFFEILRARIMVRIGAWLDRLLGPELLSFSIRSSPLLPHGSNMQLLRDLGTLRGFVAGNGVFHLFDSPWVPIYVLVVFMMHPLLGVIAIIGAAVLGAMAFLNDFATRKPLAEASRMNIGTQTRLEANARNAEVIEAMGMLPVLLNQWKVQSGKVLALQSIASDRAGVLQATTKVLRLGVQVAIMGVGVWLAVNQEISAGVMIAASIIVGRALQPVEQMIGTWKAFVGAREAYKRINERLAQPIAQRGKTQLPVPKGDLSVENVSFIPPGASVPSLQGITFNLDAGQIMGVIGPSAAGKSCLARLLIGVWEPRLGHVRLDGADVYNWERESFGRHVGYVPQDVELFAGTVKQNIARMNLDPEDADVVAAAQWADCHDMILRLPDGYDTQIGEGGHSLSGGQTQRIALARALYGDVRFLVLDEPNSNLDTAGDQALMNALKEARKRGITTVVIAHRPSLLVEVDQLLMLGDGKVALFGPCQEIMARLNNQQKVTPLHQKTSTGR